MGKTTIIAILILALIGVVIYYEYPRLISNETNIPKINLNPLDILNPETKIEITSNMEWSLSMYIGEKTKMPDTGFEIWLSIPNYLTRNGNYTYNVKETNKHKITYIYLSINHPIYEELPKEAYIQLIITKGNKIILNKISTTRKPLEYKPDIDF